VAALALLSLAVIAYTYVGYPVLVAAWARLAPRRVRASDSFEPTVSICIAAYNGEKYLEAKLRSLQALDYPREKIEILVCSDGSTDGTARIVQEFTLKDTRIGLLATGERVGKPSALNILSASAILPSGASPEIWSSRGIPARAPIGATKSSFAVRRPDSAAW
jgi:cellulose synthase/poly-beta-1,6-N-acetylglucosamine synthase-like glycosyltransferase